MIPTSRLLPLLAAAALSPATRGQQRDCVLAHDLSPGLDASYGSEPRPEPNHPGNRLDEKFVSLAGAHYFSARTRWGTALGRTDGSTAGTTLLRQFPGYGDGPRSLTALGSTLFFVTEDPDHGAELWKTDGTTAGTTLVADIRNGEAGSQPRQLVAFGSILLFAADDGVHGQELWASDGTAGGTRLVADLEPGAAGSDPSGLIVDPRGTQVLFGTLGMELWRTDGTTSGTALILDVAPGLEDSNLTYLQPLGDQVLFGASDGTHGYEPWITDGTAAGTRLLADLYPGSRGSSPQFPWRAFASGELPFLAGGRDGYELWKTDGTAAGTVQVLDIRSGSGSSVPDALGQGTDTIWFAADDGVHGDELWTSDGTTAGTVMVADIRTGSGSSYLDHGVVVGDVLYFRADDGVHGSEIWRSDGTAAGTTLLTDSAPGSDGADPRYLTALSGGRILARLELQATGSELYTIDTATQTVALTADLDVRPASSDAEALTVTLDGSLLLVADDGSHGREPWVIDPDGSARLLLDIHAGTADSGIERFRSGVVGGRVRTFFSAQDGIHGHELWTTDGTTAGTVLFADLNPGTESSYPWEVVFSGGLAYFAASGTAGRELWVTDGTAAGTRVLDLIPGSSGSYPSDLIAFAGMVAYTADSGSGIELHVSDGTLAGTRMVADLATGSSYPHGFVVHEGELFFVADTDATGEELWKTDGTAAGTQLVADLRNGSEGSEPYDPVSFGGRLFFGADDGIHGRELWSTDGTTAGTTLFLDLEAGAGGANPGGLTAADGALFFAAWTSTDGYEIWRTDGTAANTIQVTDAPGTASTGYEALHAVGGGVLISGDDGVVGYELFFSDGTLAGTGLLADLNPGPIGADAYEFVDFAGSVWFTADSVDHGRELFRCTGLAAARDLGAQSVGGATLHATAPILGSTATLRWDDGPANALGVLLLDVPFTPYTDGLFLADSYAAVSPFGVTVAMTTESQGLAALPVPDLQGLAGVQLHTQLWWFDGAQTFPITPSNGVELTLQR